MCAAQRGKAPEAGKGQGVRQGVRGVIEKTGKTLSVPGKVFLKRVKSDSRRCVLTAGQVKQRPLRHVKQHKKRAELLSVNETTDPKPQGSSASLCFKGM